MSFTNQEAKYAASVVHNLVNMLIDIYIPEEPKSLLQQDLEWEQWHKEMSEFIDSIQRTKQ